MIYSTSRGRGTFCANTPCSTEPPDALARSLAECCKGKKRYGSVEAAEAAITRVRDRQAARDLQTCKCPF